MCDYSLHEVTSRPAKIGEKLVTTEFRHTLTRGFSAVDDTTVAVCLLPGTELSFDAEVQLRLGWLQDFLPFKSPWKIGHRVGRFRQINLNNPNTHHDAIEFPDGRVVLLTCLHAGQCATVLQLPAGASWPPAANPQALAHRSAHAR